jgi:hypothetical protein
MSKHIERNMIKKAAHVTCQVSLAIRREMGNRLDTLPLRWRDWRFTKILQS